jgi:hypothetical protein
MGAEAGALLGRIRSGRSCYCILSIALCFSSCCVFLQSFDCVLIPHFRSGLQTAQVAQLKASHVDLEAELKIARSNLALAETHAESLEEALRRRPLPPTSPSEQQKPEEPGAEERASRTRERSGSFWRLGKRKQSPGPPGRPSAVTVAPPTPPPRSSTSHSTYSDEGRSLRHTASSPALPKTPISALFGYDQIPPPLPSDSAIATGSATSSPVLSRLDTSFTPSPTQSFDRQHPNADVTDLHHALEEARAAYASLNAVHMSLASEHQGLRSSHAKLLAERDRLQTAHDNLQNEVEALSQSLFEEANKMVADERRAKDAVEKELKRARAQVDELKLALQAADKTAEDYAQREPVVERENRDLRSRVAELELEAELGLSARPAEKGQSSLAAETVPLPESRTQTPVDSAPSPALPTKRWFPFRRSRPEDEPAASTPALALKSASASPDPSSTTPAGDYFGGRRTPPEKPSTSPIPLSSRPSRFTPTTASSSSCESRPSVSSSLSGFEDRMLHTDSPRTAETPPHDSSSSSEQPQPFAWSLGKSGVSSNSSPPVLPRRNDTPTRPYENDRRPSGEESRRGDYDGTVSPNHRERTRMATATQHMYDQRDDAHRIDDDDRRSSSRSANYDSLLPPGMTGSSLSTSPPSPSNWPSSSSAGRRSPSVATQDQQRPSPPPPPPVISSSAPTHSRPPFRAWATLTSSDTLSVYSAVSDPMGTATTAARRRPSTESTRSQPDQDSHSTRSSSPLPPRRRALANARTSGASSQSSSPRMISDDLDAVSVAFSLFGFFCHARRADIDTG